MFSVLQRGARNVSELAPICSCLLSSCRAFALQSPEPGAQCTVDLAQKWKLLKEQGHQLNPCGSKLHPAVLAGVLEENRPEQCLQRAYTPQSHCFGCGPANVEGLGLESWRSQDGLIAHITLDKKYEAFPGIVNGGIISTVLDCHGNWTAAVALMDRSCLPKPPLTLTYSILVTYKEPTPSGVPLIVRSHVVAIDDNDVHVIGMKKAVVEVDLTLHEQLPDGSEKLLVTGTGVFKKLGALRAK